MKDFSQIYKSIFNSIKSRLGVDITTGSMIDAYAKATATVIEEAYTEIENNKNPHLYTNLKGDNIDKLGLLINCPREANEDDRTYLKRCLDWTKNNESSNRTCIENALLNLKYSSNATYVPYTSGVGTATVFAIPIEYSDEVKAKAIEEIGSKLANITSPDSYIEIRVPDPIPVKIAVYVSMTGGDNEYIKNNLEARIRDYVNNIPIGDVLSYGQINKLGVAEAKVEFFNATHIYLDDELMDSLNTVQGVGSKFLFDKIIWRSVVE